MFFVKIFDFACCKMHPRIFQLFVLTVAILAIHNVRAADSSEAGKDKSSERSGSNEGPGGGGDGSSEKTQDDQDSDSASLERSGGKGREEEPQEDNSNPIQTLLKKFTEMGVSSIKKFMAMG